MPPPTYRFRVQLSSGECSQDWRVWVEDSEIYLAPRSIGHHYKASFHSTGQCQVGLSSEVRKSLIGDPSWDGKSRLFSVWQAPGQYTGNEQAMLIELMFPGSYLDEVPTKPGKSVDVIDCPDVHVVSVGLLKSSLRNGAVLKSNDFSFRELIRLPCSNGCSLSVVSRVLPETETYRDYLRERYWSHYLAEPSADGRTYGSRGGAPETAALRALLWDARTEPKQWHEVSAQKIHRLGSPQNSPPLPRGEA
jgi:hypothetical protein